MNVLGNMQESGWMSSSFSHLHSSNDREGIQQRLQVEAHTAAHDDPLHPHLRDPPKSIAVIMFFIT